MTSYIAKIQDRRRRMASNVTVAAYGLSEGLQPETTKARMTRMLVLSTKGPVA